jgi:hypothetical protein
MNVESFENNLNEQRQLLSSLQHLLQKQIEMVRHSDIGAVELISRQADDLAKKIAQTKILEQSGFKDQREQLRRLYIDLCLVLATEKADVAGRLKHIRKGKKTIAAYHNNIGWLTHKQRSAARLSFVRGTILQDLKRTWFFCARRICRRTMN